MVESPASTDSTRQDSAPAPAPRPQSTPELPEEDTSPSSDAETPLAQFAVGTRENPAPFGSTARIGDWEVTPVSVDTDAESRVLAANMFNSPADNGFRYVIINVSATYVGEESGSPFWDLSWKLLGNRGNTFDGRCGVIPDALRDGGETFPGGVVTGNICIAAPEDQLAESAVIVEGLFQRESRTFFAIPNRG